MVRPALAGASRGRGTSHRPLALTTPEAHPPLHLSRNGQLPEHFRGVAEATRLTLDEVEEERFAGLVEQLLARLWLLAGLAVALREDPKCILEPASCTAERCSLLRPQSPVR
jgi:hypothetical protein